MNRRYAVNAASTRLQPRDLTPEEVKEIWRPVHELLVAEYQKTLRFSCADCDLGWVSEAEWHEHIASAHLAISILPATPRVQTVGEEEMQQQQIEDRAVLVVLRQGAATPHTGPDGGQVKEVVQGVANWEILPNESLELWNSDHKLVATFRDWSFVKFMDSRK